MKFDDILKLDCSEAKNLETLKRALSKTKWLERFEPEEITLDVLEKLYRKVTDKYPGRIAYIQNAGDNSMNAMIKNTDTHQWIETIYFISFYECVAKVLLVMYGYFIKGMNMKDEKRKVDED